MFFIAPCRTGVGTQGCKADDSPELSCRLWQFHVGAHVGSILVHCVVRAYVLSQPLVSSAFDPCRSSGLLADTNGSVTP